MLKRIVQIIIVVTVSLSFVNLDAQIVKQIGVEVGYDNNAFRNYAQITDYSTNLSLYFAKDKIGKNWEHRFFYESYYNLYKNYTDRFSHYHQLGYSAGVSPFNRGDVLSIGAYGALNRRKIEYNYANYILFSSYTNYKLRPLQNVILQFGFKAKYQNYENLTELTHWENMAFNRISWFLPSRTSLIFYSRIGVKNYKNKTVETMTEVESQGNGDGPGNYNPEIITTTSEVPGITASQLILNLKVGQSLTQTAGLSLQYQRRLNLKNNIRLSTDPRFEMIISEEDIYDDPYGYESHEFHGVLTKLLPWNLKFKTGYSFYDKHYQVEALDLDGFPIVQSGLRTDRRQIGWGNVTKIFPKTRVLQNIQLSFDLYYLKNTSNDAYYDFDNLIFTIGSEFLF